MEKMRQVLLLLTFLISGAISQPVYAYQDAVCHEKGETPLFMDEYGEDFRPLTSAIKVPVLYLYGRQDYAVGPDHYKTLHFPNAVVLGADCGHMVFLEEPAVFAEALDKFCQLLAQ